MSKSPLCPASLLLLFLLVPMSISSAQPTPKKKPSIKVNDGVHFSKPKSELRERMSPEQYSKLMRFSDQANAAYNSAKAIRKKLQLAPGNLRIVRHVKGKNGVPLPKNARTVLELEKYFGKEQKEKAIAGLQERVKQQVDRYSAPRKVGICTKDKKIYTKKNFSGGQKKSGVLDDMLFIPEELVPTSDEQRLRLYGALTKIYPVSRNKPSVVNLGMEKLGIPCIPARVRVTTDGLYFFTGQKALKHFDHTGMKGTITEEAVDLWTQFQLNHMASGN